ncbi:MAG: RND family transporter [Candidatus Abyssobacteria bacterium SURF_17]|uniref:RND family transporter n=1 Tax=Candidatus Abyssobacteria bacterium SURF_17 TaxID=2093361 RepID=A0A419F6D8_9BACT|nr:MAG: RND family transporter [Candidatus Abyssubacteria bacterium SURF_17]
MDRFYKFIARFPKATILIVLIATVGIAVPVRSLRLETDVETMMPQHHPVFIYNKKVEEIFGTKKMIIVGIIHEGPHGVFNPQTLKLVEQLSLRIEGLDGIIGEDIVSLQTLDNIVGSEGGLEVVRLMETAPETQEAADEIRRATLDNEMFINNVVSPDGAATSIFGKIETGYDKVEMYDRIKRMVLEDFELGDNQVIIAGRPVIEGTIGRYAAEDMRKTLPLVTLVSLIVLWLTLRTARGVLLPITVVISSVLWTLGIMALLNIPLYAVTTVLPVLLMAIGLAYGIHIINRYYEEAAARSHTGRTELVISTMHQMWAPVTMASLTTAAGFLSLATSDMMPIKYLGIFTAIGVVSALVFSLTFIPAWLVLLPVRYPGLKQASADAEINPLRRDRLSRALVGSGQWIAEHPKTIVTITVVVIIFGVAGLFRVYVDGSLLSNFQPDSEVLIADTILNQKFGGTNTLNIIIEGQEQDDMKSPDILRAIENLQRELERTDEVGATLSLADYIKRMNRVMNENQKEYLCIPNSRELVAQYLLLYSLSGDPDDFDDVVDYDYRLANMRIRINSDHSPVLKKVIENVNASAARLFAGLSPKVHLAGHVMTSYTFNNLIIRGQTLSILTAIAMVFLITSLMFRSPTAGLFCIIPVAIATLLNFSLMGATGIPLGVTTALLSGMGIGIGVDYAIHFVARYRWLSQTTSDCKERIQATLGTAGRAILFNALVITAGFLVLMISNFPPSRWLSALVSLNMVACFLGALTVLPACMVLFRPTFADRIGGRPPTPFRTKASII